MSLTNQAYLSAPEKLVKRHGTKPRIVTNMMGPQYRVYLKQSTDYWADFPASTPLITWGETVDGSQSFTVTTDGATSRVWAQFNQSVVAGETWILSFTVESTSGVMVNNNVSIFGVTGTGTTSINAPAVGRHGMKFVTTQTGTLTMRIGIGTDGAGPLNASIKFSNIMIDKVGANDARTYPYEYVNANAQRAFNYSYSATQTGSLITSETVGTAYAVPRGCSVLVVGDSMTNDIAAGANFGDFPYQMRRFSKNIAVASHGVPGETIAQTEAQMTTAITDNFADSRALPWQCVILQGGTNDVNGGRTLAQMQADQLSRIALAESYGLIPICVTCPPLNAATAGQQTIIDGYNTWVKTLGYRYYDVYSDADNGSGDWKTSWGSGDGVHPGVLWNNGSAWWAKKMSDLCSLIGSTVT